MLDNDVIQLGFHSINSPFGWMSIIAISMSVCLDMRPLL